MNRELNRRLDLIDDKINRLNDRESRKLRFRFNIYSILFGTIIALATTLIVEFIKSIIPSSFAIFVGVALYLCVFVGLILWAVTKKIMDIGDFEFSGNLDINKSERKKFIDLILKELLKRNKTLRLNDIQVDFEGLHYFGFLYHQWNNSFNEKLDYCMKESKHIKSLELSYKSNKEKGFTQFYFNFKEKKFIISLNDKDFAINDAKFVYDNLKKLRKSYSFFNESVSQIRGF